jgi:hypothetical protein
LRLLTGLPIDSKMILCLDVTCVLLPFGLV